MAKAGVIIAAGVGLALAAGLRHSATEFPSDKELGPWSSYFSQNSQVKLVRNPVYRDELGDAVIGNVPPSLWHHLSLWTLVKIVATKGVTYEEAAAQLQAQPSLAHEMDPRTITFADCNSAEAKLVRQVRSVPDWVNEAELERGRMVHEMNAVAVGTVLLCGSLVLSYACKNGNKVLMETRRLSTTPEGVWRRLAETWHFVISVQQARDTLAVGGVGFDAVVSVRLLHAVVRRYCLRKEWKTAIYGSPINQEDMLGTLASFSPCVLIGLEKIGLGISLEDQDAYCARWRYVGYLLGLTPAALDLIQNYHSARYVGEVIALRQLSPDEDSALLTSASLNAVETHYPVLSKAPKPLRSVLSFWCRWLLGTALADAMNVRKPGVVTTIAWALVRLMLCAGPRLSRCFPFLFKPIWLTLNRFYQWRVSRAEFPGKKRIAHAFKTD